MLVKEFIKFILLIVAFIFGATNKNDLLQTTAQLPTWVQFFLKTLLYIAFVTTIIFILNEKSLLPVFISALIQDFSIWKLIKKVSDFVNIFIENKFLIILWISIISLTYLMKQTNKKEYALFTESRLKLLGWYKGEIDKLIYFEMRPKDHAFTFHRLKRCLLLEKKNNFLINFRKKCLISKISPILYYKKNKNIISFLKQYFQCYLCRITNLISSPKKDKYRNIRIFTRSIYVITPQELIQKKLTNIKNLCFEHTAQFYSLPIFISSEAKAKLIEKFYHQSSDKNNYNGATLRVKDLSSSKKNIILKMQTSTYFNYLVTNMIPEVEILYKTTVRDLLEPHSPKNKLNLLSETQAENHLGLSCLIVNQQNEILVGLRTENVHVFRNQLSPSISGAANINTCRRNNDPTISPVNWLLNEMEEELFSKFKRSELNKSLDFRTKLCNKTIFLGMSRELIRLGKPEVFFAIQLNDDDNYELISYLEEQNKIISVSDEIDKNENSKLLWLNLSDILPQEKNNNIIIKNGDYIYIDEHMDEYKLSESLWVNIIMYQTYTQSLKGKNQL